MISCLPLFGKKNQEVNDSKTTGKNSGSATKRSEPWNQQQISVKDLPSPFIRKSDSCHSSNLVPVHSTWYFLAFFKWTLGVKMNWYTDWGVKMDLFTDWGVKMHWFTDVALIHRFAKQLYPLISISICHSVSELTKHSKHQIESSYVSNWVDRLTPELSCFI